MKLKLKILMILITVIILSSCLFFLDDGDIDSPQHSTWICTINSDGTGLHYLHEGGGTPQFTADGTKIVVGHPHNGFQILDAELGSILVSIDTLSGFFHYTLSNNNTICYSASSDLTSSKDLFIYEPVTSSITNITLTDSIDEHTPSYNNNYDKVVYILRDLVGSTVVLNIYDFITQQIITITTEILGFKYPQFSLDESQIIFSTYNSYNLFDIIGHVNTETFEGSIENYPASIYENEMTFSADGHIWRMNIDGSELMDLGLGNHPQFSPDGSKIAFDGLYIMNSDGTDKQKLTEELGEYPNFSPDGSKIVFLMEKYDD